MRTKVTAFVAAALAASFLVACSTAPKSRAERKSLKYHAQATVEEYRDVDPEIDDFFDDSYGYAVFPAVGKGGFIVGGGYGRGVVYRGDSFYGYSDITQGTFGLTAGGQGFSEVIFFQTRSAFEDFVDGRFSLSAQASAVAVDAGASAQTRYRNGVAIFIRGESGAMVDASVGGQGFSFVSAAEYNDD